MDWNAPPFGKNKKTLENITLNEAMEMLPGNKVWFNPPEDSKFYRLEENKRYIIKSILGTNNSGKLVYRFENKNPEITIKTGEHITNLYFTFENIKGNHFVGLFDKRWRIEEVIKQGKIYLSTIDIADALGETIGYNNISLNDYLLILEMDVEEEKKEDNFFEVDRVKKVKYVYEWIKNNTAAQTYGQANKLIQKREINVFVIEHWKEEGYSDASKQLKKYLKQGYPDLFN